MKALSLHQPWATWIATGAKSIETRTRPVSYRGPLLICSTKRPPEATDPGYTRPDEFPLGVAVAVAELVDVGPHQCAAFEPGRSCPTTRTKPCTRMRWKTSAPSPSRLRSAGSPACLSRPPT